MKLLLKYGAEKDIHVNGEDTPLRAAIWAGAGQICEILLDAGSDANRKGKTPATALYMACRSQDTKMVTLLLAHGADPNIQQCGRYDHALQAACRNGCEEIVDLLLKSGAKTDLTGGYFDNALQAACVVGNIPITRMLLSHGADATRIGGVCGNAMLAAVHGKNETIVDILLDCGVSINENRGTNTYPLLRALDLKAWDGQESFVQHLLIRGADPNLELDGGRALQQGYFLHRTPLQYAVSTSLKTTSMLLDHGAQIDAVVGGHTTALIVAALWTTTSVVRLLLDRSADINLSTWLFGSPLVATCRPGRLDIAKVLVDAGTDLHTTNLVGHSALLMTVLSRKSQLELFIYLISKGADPFQEDKRGCNGLHYAARAKKMDFIKRMLEYGLNVNAIDHNGWSSLHWAISSTEGSVDVVKLLLGSGCDISIKDKQGRTAVDLAKTFTRKEETAILAGTTEAHTPSCNHQESRVLSSRDRICDGCDIVSKPPIRTPDHADNFSGTFTLQARDLAHLRRLC